MDKIFKIDLDNIEFTEYIIEHIEGSLYRLTITTYGEYLDMFAFRNGHPVLVVCKNESVIGEIIGVSLTNNDYMKIVIGYDSKRGTTTHVRNRFKKFE